MLRSIALKLFRFYSIRKNVHVAKSVHIGIGTIISAPYSLVIERGTYIGKFCTIQVNGSIGKGVLIANSVGIVGRRDHDYATVGVPMRFCPWIGDPNFARDGAADKVVIEDDVWIGYGAIVLSKLRIGRGAIVAAGANVVSDVEPYTIVAGVPAKPVAKRFQADQISEHEKKLAEYWAASKLR